MEVINYKNTKKGNVLYNNDLPEKAEIKHRMLSEIVCV